MSAKRYETCEDWLYQPMTALQLFDAALAKGAARERERLLAAYGSDLKAAAQTLASADDMPACAIVQALIEALGGEA